DGQRHVDRRKTRTRRQARKSPTYRALLEGISRRGRRGRNLQTRNVSSRLSCTDWLAAQFDATTMHPHTPGIQSTSLLVIPGSPSLRERALPLIDGNIPRAGGLPAGPP